MRTEDGRPPTRRTTAHPESAPIARANEWSSPAPRMRGVSHRHVDHDSRAWDWFARGPVVAADGGKREAGPSRDDRQARDVETEQLRHVSHTPTHGEGANAVWNRGHDAAADDVPGADGGEADEDAV